MKIFLPAFLIAALLLITPADAASSQVAAKKELQGWSVAAKEYEQTCHAGKLRQQMPKNKAVHAYECFAQIIDTDVELQYPDLYARLNDKMKAAHGDYAAGKLNWDETLEKLKNASDEYNAAVARRNQKTGND